MRCSIDVSAEQTRLCETERGRVRERERERESWPVGKGVGGGDQILGLMGLIEPLPLSPFVSRDQEMLYNI